MRFICHEIEGDTSANFHVAACKEHAVDRRSKSKMDPAPPSNPSRRGTEDHLILRKCKASQFEINIFASVRYIQVVGGLGRARSVDELSRYL